MICGDINEIKQKAESGVPDAIAQLGMAYLYGYGVEIDHVQAFIYLQDAAIKNNGEAQLNLGKMYENGWGIKKDLWTAYALYRHAYNMKSSGARKAIEHVVEKLVEGMPITGQLTISSSFKITLCCNRLKEHIRMGKIVPFEDDDGCNFYFSNINRNTIMRECPYCGECVFQVPDTDE
ncbi:MAG: sel1 repeat family protein [archaeon]|nr:sel1 repeat family protein [archaeon]